MERNGNTSASGPGPDRRQPVPPVSDDKSVKETDGRRQRRRTIAVCLLTKEPKGRKEAMLALKKAYDRRSSVAHTGHLGKKQQDARMDLDFGLRLCAEMLKIAIGRGGLPLAVLCPSGGLNRLRSCRAAASVDSGITNQGFSRIELA